MKNEQAFILTDCCMWEKNKKDGTARPHAIEVVDVKTGQLRYIKSGSIISFLQGEITPTRSQEAYNKVSTKPKNKLQGRVSKKSSEESDKRKPKD